MGEKREKDREKSESRAVIEALRGGGMVMFSCTGEAADAAEACLAEAKSQHRTVDIADILAAMNKWQKKT
jgi:hypothetical protein